MLWFLVASSQSKCHSCLCMGSGSASGSKTCSSVARDSGLNGSQTGKIDSGISGSYSISWLSLGFA